MGLDALVFPRPQHGDSLLGNNHPVKPAAAPFNWSLAGIGSGEETRSRVQKGTAELKSGVSSNKVEFPEQSVSGIARYESLIRVFSAIGHHNGMSELISMLAAEVSPLINFDFIGISRYDEATSVAEWHVAMPGGGAESGNLDAKTEETMTGWVYQNQKPLVIPSLHRDTRLSSGISKLVQDGIQSVCAVPLSCAKHRLGCLFIGSVIENAYSGAETRFLSVIATQVAGAIEINRAHGQIAQLKDRLEQQTLYLEDEIREDHGFDEIIGRSAALRSVLREVEIVAPTDSTVLIYGETGTGKELIARAIHDRSARHKNAFVKLNCAAIPTGLLESELFGHEKGAFTGAIAQRIGRFELANHGTMFLDEIGEIPLELQPKLLRVLQEREFERLGNSRTLQTNTRLVAATNRDLDALVGEQRFRSDLFYRLNVFPIRIPSLRQRPEDIPLLVRHFAQQYARRMNKEIASISSETMSALCRYGWPGNIRELQNVVERAVIVSKDSQLRVSLSDLKSHIAPSQDGVANQTLEEAERAHILATLKQTRWVISGPSGAAARLGMNRSTLQFRMKKLGISRPGS
jgi:formate hydrogenlyase transcriptional activator